MQIHEKDIYDLEVERLTKHPELIEESWLTWHPLFKTVGNRESVEEFERYNCGCVSQIKNLNWKKVAFIDGKFHENLTHAIREDDMIPDDVDARSVAHLPHFAKWQRRIDRMNAGESFEDVMKENTKL